MKAAICYEYKKPLVIEEIEIPPLKENEVKVRIAATAICHSDIHFVKGEAPVPLPFVAGHESSGYIVEVGASVTSVKPNDPVVLSLLKSCRNCFYCITGNPHLCETRLPPLVMPEELRLKNDRGQFLFAVDQIGSYAEYVVVDHSMVVKIPEGIPMESAALLACGVTTGFGSVVNRAKVRPFDSVVVIGIGGVGVNAIQGAAYSGAYPIIAIDVLDSRLKDSIYFGATHYINGKQPDAIEQVKQLTAGRGADYVFITVGSVGAIQQGILMSGLRGTIVLIGIPPNAQTVPLAPFDIVTTERSLIGSMMGSTNTQLDIPRLVELYKSGHLKLDELVTGRYHLEQVNEAIESTLRGEGFRNVITFNI